MALVFTGLAVAAFACYTLVSEGEAATPKQSGYSFPYLAAKPPSPQELDWRTKAMAALGAANVADAFHALAGDGDTLSRDQFHAILSAAVHTTISGAAASVRPEDLGPLAAFATTVKSESQKIVVRAPVLVNRIFDTIDTAEPKGQVTIDEMLAFQQLMVTDPMGGAILLLDSHGDGMLSSSEVDPVITDYLALVISVLHQGVDVVVAGAEAVLEPVSNLGVLFFPGGVTMDALWQRVLTLPGGMDNVFPDYVFANPTTVAQLQKGLTQWEGRRDTFAAAIEAGGNPAGLDVDEVTALARAELQGPLSSNVEFQGLVATLQTMPGMPEMPDAFKAATAVDVHGAHNTTLRGGVPAPVLPPGLAAVVDAIQESILAEQTRIVYAMFVVLDTNGDGFLSVQEYGREGTVLQALVDTSTPKASRLRTVLSVAFDMTDADGDGTITAAELHRGLSNVVQLVRQVVQSGLNVVSAVLPEGVPLATDALFAAVDADGDGSVSAADAAAAWAALSPPHPN